MTRRNGRAKALLTWVALAIALWLVGRWVLPGDESADGGDTGDDIALVGPVGLIGSTLDGGPTLINRVWISRLPETPREKIDVFIMVDDPQIGAFQTTSAFEGDFSFFQWNGERGLRIHMLQADTDHRLRARWTNRGCEPYDYCLKLSGAPRGSENYVSMKDWVIDAEQASDPSAIRSFLRQQLGAP